MNVWFVFIGYSVSSFFDCKQLNPLSPANFAQINIKSCVDVFNEKDTKLVILMKLLVSVNKML